MLSRELDGVFLALWCCCSFTSQSWIRLRFALSAGLEVYSFSQLPWQINCVNSDIWIQETLKWDAYVGLGEGSNCVNGGVLINHILAKWKSIILSCNFQIFSWITICRKAGGEFGSGSWVPWKHKARSHERNFQVFGLDDTAGGH